MGNATSIPPAHSRIYENIIQIRDPGKRAEMIQIVLAGAEYIQSAKRAGIYPFLLAYVSKVQKGQMPDPLPGERPVGGSPSLSSGNGSRQIVSHQEKPRGAQQELTVPHGKERAIGYFQSSLEMLGLEEEVALTEETLKKAYKQAALRTHPDKSGGSEEKFEAVTRAYAYLSEILRRINGGRAKAGVVEAPNTLQESRADQEKDWKHVEPIRLNPKKLDVEAFNKMFEQTRIPDPDDDGYGDWLKTKNDDNKQLHNFGGKFNRDVFNKVFEEQARAQGQAQGQAQGRTQLIHRAPEALTLAPNMGVGLGREKSESYTAPYNANMKYTDLKQAYTTENTLSHQVSDVRVETRDLKQYRATREKAPEPLTSEEMALHAEADRQAAERERQRQLRAAHEGVFADQYFQRMKRLVISNESAAGTGSDAALVLHKRYN
jgi:curved DNA-binding protein CbpA